MNWLDFTGASLSLICTYSFTQGKRYAWLIGIAAIILNFILYWQKGIYGHLLLEIIYLFTMLYGWYHWSAKKSPFLIRTLKFSQGLGYSLLATVSIPLMAQALMYGINSDIPYWDATTTVLSLLAQWLLCIKVLDCWIVWFVVDALIASLQWHKSIPFHSVLHVLYLAMAVLGFIRWKKLYQQQKRSHVYIVN